MEGFEWDTAKAKANLKKHGVGFTAATRVFEEIYRIEWEDTRDDYGEERYITVGKVKTEVLAVVYTVREELIRIISARRASNKEKREYYANRPF